jgi:hypothetical protein
MKKSILPFFLILFSWQFIVVGQGTDNLITGVVLDLNESKGLPSATVIALNTSTGFRTGVVSDLNGRFTLQNLPIGGPYNISVSFLGYSKYEISGLMLAIGDYVDMGTINLSSGAEMLEEVVVSFDTFTSDRKRLGTATRIDNVTMQRIPSATRNYQDLAALSSLTVGPNPAGQNRNQTGFVLDGVPNRRNTFGDIAGGAFGVSMEAIQEFEVSNNDYDVTASRGGGMVIKATTKSGTNELKGSVFGYNSSQGFTGNTFIRDPSGESFGTQEDFSVRQMGFSLGGPVVKNKLHFFVTADFYRNELPYTADDFDKAGATLSEAEKVIGITKANMDEIVNILQGPTYGIPVPSHGKQYGTIPSSLTTGAAMAKLDWSINEKNHAMIKYNYHVFNNPRKRNGLLSTQYEEDSYDHSITLQLRTDVSTRSFNDLRVNYIHHMRANGWHFNRAPVGQVQVRSEFEDGSNRTRNVIWGNQHWVPEIISETNYSLVNNYHFTAGKIRYTAGGEVLVNTINDLLTHYQQGHFFYDGIENLRNNIPYRYERKTPMSSGAGDYVRPYTIFPALYAQMQTTLWDHVDFAAGLRWDAQIIPLKPTYNKDLNDLLGVNNAGVPFDATGIQPRMNVIWDVGGKGTDIVKFGAGRFVSQPTTQSLTMSHIDNGVDYFWVVADTRLAGFTQADLPAANWPGFFSDWENNIPGPEYINGLLSKGIISAPPAFVIAIDENLKMPKTWKFNANYHHYFSPRFNVGIGAYYTHTWGNFYYTNRNLGQPQFFLESEGNRAVYVPEATLIGKREAIADNARLSNNFTQVMEFTNADWPNTFIAVVAEANMRIGKDGSISTSYTRGESKGGVHYTSGNSREFHYVGRSYHDWGKEYQNYPDRDQLRHKLIFTGISPTIKGFSLGLVFTGIQGIGFTMNMPRDILGVGRGAPTDNVTLAYIFDPNDSATPQYLRDGINHVLENSDPLYADYIKEHIGTFAAPWAGKQPWRYDLNVSVSKSFKIFGSHSFQIRADIFNLPNLLNKEWGGFHEIYNTNLYSGVTGWDAENRRWIYTINENAGQKRYRVTSPYQVHIGARYSF